MGYYTNFCIEIRSNITKETAKKIVKSINDKIGCTNFYLYEPRIEIKDTDETTWDIESDGEVKWYDWEYDMDKITTEYPDVEFRIEGRGEDRGDWWIALLKGKRKQIRYAAPPIDHWEDSVDFSSKL